MEIVKVVRFDNVKYSSVVVQGKAALSAPWSVRVQGGADESESGTPPLDPDPPESSPDPPELELPLDPLLAAPSIPSASLPASDA